MTRGTGQGPYPRIRRHPVDGTVLDLGSGDRMRHEESAMGAFASDTHQHRDVLRRLEIHGGTKLQFSTLKHQITAMSIILIGKGKCTNENYVTTQIS